eukprot:GHVH01001493.1.p1 GENE.GHVH01001493.1~~GHVH01001493.1.p1  ORF type:complete len:776 (+),score=101.11 GHVH01001493.1:248-2575(+)
MATTPSIPPPSSVQDDQYPSQDHQYPSLKVSISKTGIDIQDVGQAYDELRRHSDESTMEGHRHANELADILNLRGGELVARLQEVVDRTVSDSEYRLMLANDEFTVSNLVKVLKQTVTRLEPVYDQISMSVDALRMDTGGVSEDHQARLYITKWSLVLRILNIIKNLLVSNRNIQEDLYQHKVLLQVVKLLPKAMVARELAITQGRRLLSHSANWNSQDIPRGFLKMAVPICSKADVTVVTFFLNSIAGSKKMQDFIRPQLWSGPMALLAMTIVCTKPSAKKGSAQRYAKGLSNYITLFHTLFLNVTDVELADWWELEDSPFWSPQGVMGYEREHAESRAAINNSLQRTATNLSMQLTIPGWSNGSESSKSRTETVVGALMEPQTSSVEGKGVHMLRMKSFKVLADNAKGGSLGLSGRESLLIVLVSICAGLKQVEEDKVNAADVYYVWEVLIRNMSRRGGIVFWHAFFKSFRKCRSVSRLMKAVLFNMKGPGNAIYNGKEDHSEDSIYYMMSNVMLSNLNTLFTQLDLTDANLSLEQLDNDLLYKSEELNNSLIRCCVSEVLISNVLIKIMTESSTESGAEEDSSKSSSQLENVINFMTAEATVEGGQSVSILSDMLTESEQYDNMKLYTIIRDLLESSFHDHPAYIELLAMTSKVAEDCDPTEPMSQLASGSILRTASMMMRFLKPGPEKNQIVDRSLRTAFRWLNVMQKIIQLEQFAMQQSKQQANGASEKVKSVGELRRYLVRNTTTSGRIQQRIDLLVDDPRSHVCYTVP